MTTSAPPASPEDDIRAAIALAQQTFSDCLVAMPQCDPATLSVARAGPLLERNVARVQEWNAAGYTVRNRDQFRFVVESVTLGSDGRTASATVCIADGSDLVLEQLSAATKVSVALWAGLERNDFSRWPGGLYARSYVRSYAEAIGVDPDSTVDDFCRWFPQGDRRAERIIRGQAQIVGHNKLEWRDHVPPGKADGDRRGGAGAARTQPPPTLMAGAVAAFTQMYSRLRRATGARDA